MSSCLRILLSCGFLISCAPALLSQQIKLKVANKPIGQPGVPGLAALVECPLTGEPYSDAWEAESIQTLADGTQIHHERLVQKSYRDSQGRTRMERYEPASLADDVPENLLYVVIHDPVAGASYLLNPRGRTAREFPDRPDPNCWEKLEKRINAPNLTPGHSVFSSGTTNVAPGKPGSSDPCGRWRIKTEVQDLGFQSIAGLSAHGTRWTMTIPACVEGNDRPITVVTERWYCDELRIEVLTSRSDPRTGEGMGRAVKFQRSEPDSSLFQVPSGYTIIQ